MRILYVTQVDLSIPHGATRHVTAVVRELKKLGHEVTLVAPHAQLENVRCVRPPRLAPGVPMEAALSALVGKEVVRRRPDVAYVRVSASSSLVPSTLSLLRVPIVLELNGRVTEELRHRGTSELRIAAVTGGLTTITKLARATVACEETIGEYARGELGAERVHVITNGADLDVAKPGDRSEARARMGLPDQVRVITMVGTLAPELRLDLLQQAHRGLAGVALLVVGDGHQSDFVHAMAVAARPSSPVLFLGPKPHEEAVDAIRAADVCVNPRTGDLGMRSYEYAAVGLRQVCFSVPGRERLEALFGEERGVYVVHQPDHTSLRQALEDALRDERTLGPLSMSTVDHVRSQLGWSRTARELSTLLESVVA